MLTAIKSAAIWFGITSLTVLLFLVCLFLSIILFPFDRKGKIVHRQCFWWARGIINLNPFWNVTVTGLENIDPNETYVIVANHQSLADIVVLYETRAQFKWVAKQSLFSIPFIGWCLSLCKHIKLERGDLGSIKKVYREAADWLRRDMSVLFFPEGTRSTDGEIGEFQNGAFKLAIKEKKAILPISIKGTTEAIPKGTWLFRTKVYGIVDVHKPIPTTQFEIRDFERLRELARAQLV
ncbi:MAG: hypothetical protein A3G33_01175 [Omnitrophica bacterium RIFCSPLOWO2_12_FULL_44_17]|uniref:1-acyl-sn-glycerol-3-phosphate acyltransferase n=1 Tax=Candidatus Danuiimicrobium aquiferis TaxID=1801832 RepID=A0A1G1L0Z6_9BACT|nr:MAG: hypothetical protein A3B72_02490 [Omnitrophica bacterium RIFCSPHIGHO2_02_FULL_45_28]OGW91480.1 MAG: hypothetical protein A3E74_01970 [Omnitrophica bacterium RIFCSPHIGHO2_12_FULL_44_12]OGW98801.1 MAG: hypothetical protein A3G33_01175 [Omnitrophica bacterium RIFCSPLOWO2_12_FULL_44_17]OGX02507.1 MAG: hypothetical protein A3J12_00285 [Omnitrophica bacterium RIFCSPLOWO2_02_FULL_44_11]